MDVRVLHTTQTKSGHRENAFADLSAEPFEQLFKNPEVKQADLRQGYIGLTRTASFNGISWLHLYAFTYRGGQALLLARSPWKEHASKPQIRPAQTVWPASCRLWIEQTPGLR